MKQLHTYLILLSVLLLAACASNGGTSVETSKESDMRIISLMPSNTEILIELGLEAQLVAVTTVDDYPENLNEDLTRLDTFALDEESMMVLNPTHIVSHASGHDANQGIINRVAASTGADILIVEDAQNIDAIYDTITDVGQFIGEADKAENLNASLQEETEEIQSHYSTQAVEDKALILISTTPDIYIAGNNTFINDFLNTLNIENVFSDVKGYPAITAEDLIARDPGKVISTIGIDNESLTAELENVSGLGDAMITQKENQCTPDPNLISRPGPRFTDGLTAIAECIYE